MGQSMELGSELRLHSFGWNINTRPELLAPAVVPVVCRLLDVHTLSTYSQVFFDVVDPVYHFLDRARYLERCAAYWAEPPRVLEDFEALVAGVVVLGSFFADTPVAVEAELVEHAKQVLDLGCAYAPGRLSLDQAAAWIARTLYLRLATRPHLAWYASCSAMHVVEAMGLHVDLRTVDVAGRGDSSVAALTTPEFVAARRNLFECASFLNAIISADYGRSRVVLQDSITTTTTTTTAAAAAAAVATTAVLGSSGLAAAADRPMSKLTALLLRLERDLPRGARLEILESIYSLPSEPAVFALLKTDVAIHLFRRHVHIDQERLSGAESALMLTILKAGLAQTRGLLPSHQAWWNLLFTPFQALMVLLAIDSTESLELLSETMSLLDAVSHAFPCFLAGEVLQTAQTLAKGLEKRKKKQAKLLSTASNWTFSSPPPPSSSSAQNHQATDPDLPDGSTPASVHPGHAEALLDSWFGGGVDWMDLWNSTDPVLDLNFP
ncbi:hypothetical protein ASPZODRAFT_133025 [Penicilliopsis zonata CBS 506.65]|uniref:Xylanolytic transcriptional activator regulatory domain-containing protein n=1 Tax=Penicilliopsis zonata CBS 506.65 TaxID=1073090 RepID=A0A1L9SFU6_9EURO|nr:hypothetical protein ASPZODRAFT_133025 [Penicilliopsis zonata CBS 506.65]OJJ46059.1 hypothetical protein ASPZODRAFT_133025 [Penicilliopsis zonata CBS 506.65]